jgi:hypothetical protein
MAELDDTCVLYRSGLEGDEVVKAGDAGATPGSVLLRLGQAVEAIEQ